MRFYWFLLAALAIWRLTYLLVAEDGPWQAIARLRSAMARISRVFDCFYCLSLWIAVPFALVIGESALEKLLLWPALSGCAILLERATGREAAPPAAYREDKEDDDAMLR